MTNPAYAAGPDLVGDRADARAGAAVRGRRIAWAVAAIAGAVALHEAVALALVEPSTPAAPIAMLVDRTTGQVERVDLDAPRSLATNAALQRSLLSQYVIARESYDPVAIRSAYRRVALWSTGAARSGYLAAMNRPRTGAPLGGIKRDIALAATVRSVAMLGPSTALIRFDVARIGYDGRRSDTRPYVATIGFGYRGQPMPLDDRLDNPLGFEVSSYRVDPEILPAGLNPPTA